MIFDFLRKRKTQSVLPRDDFEKACEESGIEVKDEEELPQGIGAEFTPRLTAPGFSDKNWIHYTDGGYNYCIKINGGSCLANCVGYAWGRWREMLGKYHHLSRMNAERWYLNTSDGYKRGQTPKLGAVICWQKGLINDSDGAGHVAIVEKIEANGQITCSNSAYLGTRFFITKHKPPYALNGYKFQGFIYPPIDYSPKEERLAIDGLFGRLSVQALQNWLGTYPDGEISGQNKTLKKHYPNITSCTWSGRGSNCIVALQKYLNGKCFNCGNADGIIGIKTVKAWQSFLVKQGYDVGGVDGVFGPMSAKAMQMYLNSVL